MRNPRSRTFTQADEELLNGYQDAQNGTDKEVITGFQIEEVFCG